MSRLKDNLDYEVFWTGEIATIQRKLVMSDRLTETQLELIKKYSIASIYSLWEGFVVKSIQHYIEEINKLNIKTNEICLSILTHTIDTNLNLEDERKYFKRNVHSSTNYQTIY